MSSLPPGSVIGILGGGQLGRMLSVAAARLGYDVHIYHDAPGSPAARVSAAETVGAYDDPAQLTAFAKACDVVTYEWENVPVAAVETVIAAGTPVRPGAKALEMSQDRLTEKTFLNDQGIETVPFVQIDGPDEIEAALQKLGGTGILKRRRDGYDGKGQARLAAGDKAEEAWKALGSAPCILEGMAPFELEISAIIARSLDGACVTYDMPENRHVNGILRSSHLPAPVSDDVKERARLAAEMLAAGLDYVGVLALEFFVLPDGKLLANEYAPRVHNSGHWTPEACETGQFEQHMRAVAGLPLGSQLRRFDVRMDNLLGEEAIEAAGQPGVTLYGKGEVKAGRKMGHRVTRLKAAEG